MVGILHQYVLEQYWTMEIGQMADILQQLHLIFGNRGKSRLSAGGDTNPASKYMNSLLRIAQDNGRVLKMFADADGGGPYTAHSRLSRLRCSTRRTVD